MTSQPRRYHGYRFPPEIISHAVWLYYRFRLSFRDAEDLLAQRGIAVSSESIRLSFANIALAHKKVDVHPASHHSDMERPVKSARSARFFHLLSTTV